MTRRRRTFYVWAGLMALVTALYAHVFQCEFVDFDDHTHVFANPPVRAGLKGPAVAYVFSHFIAIQWIPLTWLSHMLDVQLFGLDPGWHHLGNLALHAVNSGLVFMALRALTREFRPSVAVALLFAIHPVNVESVAWVAERKNLLSTLFWLLALCAYARHAAAPGGRWMWAVAAAMALGLLAKPMLVTLPFALLLLDVWPLRRTSGMSWAALVREKTVLFLLTAASCATTLGAAAHGDSLTSARALPIDGRVANALCGYVAYLGSLFWPARLAVLYPIEAQHPVAQVVGATLLLAGVTVAFVAMRRSRPHLLVGWLWFLGVLVPVSSVFQVGSQAYADRFLYVPQLGIFWAIVWSLRSLPAPARRWLPLGAGALAVVLSCLTLRQVSYWTDTATLFEHTAAVTRENGQAHALAGLGRVKRGEYAEALGHYREAKRLMPGNAEIRAMLGEALTHTGDSDEAVAQLRAAVALDPKDDRVRRNLVSMLVRKGQMEEAAKLVPR